MDNGMNGMDRGNTGPDYDAQFLPCDTCNGELRDQEACQGCDKYDEEGNEL
jgi:hypothetical protein